MTILVVQFRTDQSEEHEQKCFKEAYPKEDIIFFNAIKNDNLDNSILNNISHVILGGSGQFYLSKRDGEETWRKNIFRIIDEILERNIPLLGICFGFELLALHQGAKVVDEEIYRETGTFKIQTCEQAGKDSLFSQMPQNFLAQLGHKDTAIEIPAHLITLAKSERVDCQAYNISGKKAWGVLFHPELNPVLMKDRILMFPSYVGEIKNIDEYVAENFKETPEAAKILELFISQV